MTNVALNRCICVHSMSQIVDIILQNLLYQHQFIPEPMQQLITNDFRSKAVNEYQRICDCLRELFKAGNIRRLRELVVILGATPYMAKEVYRIPLKFCEDHANSIDQGCGDSCGKLSHQEIKTLFIALRDTFQSDYVTSSNIKVFIYARVTKSIYNASEAEEIEEDDGFELPMKVKPKEIRVRYCQELCEEVVNDEDANDQENGLWLRFTPFFSTHL